MESAIEGKEGLDAPYKVDDNGQVAMTIREALMEMAHDIDIRHQQAKEKESGIIALDGEEREVFYLPTDEVFEKGFDPLKDGFRATPDPANPFELVDQWIEILPTDQIVAVSVEYDPKTGQLQE